MEEKAKNTVVEEPIQQQEKKENNIFTKVKKFGKWAGLVAAGLGIGAAGYYIGKKTSTTTTTETETTEI